MHTPDTAIAALRRSTESFLALLDGVSDAQWRLRPAGEGWSLAEAVEHVAVSNQLILARLESLLRAPLAPDAVRIDDAAISLDLFRNEPGAPAPALAEPTGRFATRAEAVAALAAASDAIAARSRDSGADLREHGAPHPLFGLFDGVQWILFASVHTDNHAAQILALRAHPGLAAASEMDIAR